MPPGELAGHEEPELVAAGQVERRRIRQPGVDIGELVLGQAEPAVLDLHGESPADDVTADQHRGVRRREDGGVLGELGEHVNDVPDRGPGQGGPGSRGDLDPGVVLNLGDCRPEHVDQRHRVTPPARGRVAGEDDQALGVPAHASGQVVDAEEILELLRLRGPALHGVEQ